MADIYNEYARAREAFITARLKMFQVPDFEPMLVSDLKAIAARCCDPKPMKKKKKKTKTTSGAATKTKPASGGQVVKKKRAARNKRPKQLKGAQFLSAGFVPHEQNEA